MGFLVGKDWFFSLLSRQDCLRTFTLLIKGISAVLASGNLPQNSGNNSRFWFDEGNKPCNPHILFSSKPIIKTAFLLGG